MTRGVYKRTEAHNMAIKEGVRRYFAQKNGIQPKELAKTEQLAICPYCGKKVVIVG